jgi:hypothetical protein
MLKKGRDWIYERCLVANYQFLNLVALANFKGLSQNGQQADFAKNLRASLFYDDLSNYTMSNSTLWHYSTVPLKNVQFGLRQLYYRFKKLRGCIGIGLGGYRVVKWVLRTGCRSPRPTPPPFLYARKGR